VLKYNILAPNLPRSSDFTQKGCQAFVQKCQGTEEGNRAKHFVRTTHKKLMASGKAVESTKDVNRNEAIAYDEATRVRDAEKRKPAKVVEKPVVNEPVSSRKGAKNYDAETRTRDEENRAEAQASPKKLKTIEVFGRDGDVNGFYTSTQKFRCNSRFMFHKAGSKYKVQRDPLGNGKRNARWILYKDEVPMNTPRKVKVVKTHNNKKGGKPLLMAPENFPTWIRLPLPEISLPEITLECDAGHEFTWKQEDALVHLRSEPYKIPCQESGCDKPMNVSVEMKCSNPDCGGLEWVPTEDFDGDKLPCAECGALGEITGKITEFRRRRLAVERLDQIKHINWK